MMTATRIYAEAYELKDGGFRAVAAEYHGKKAHNIKRGEVVETFDQAKFEAKKFAFNLLDDRYSQPGYYRNPKNNWRMNYWLAT